MLTATKTSTTLSLSLVTNCLNFHSFVDYDTLVLRKLTVVTGSLLVHHVCVICVKVLQIS